MLWSQRGSFVCPAWLVLVTLVTVNPKLALERRIHDDGPTSYSLQVWLECKQMNSQASITARLNATMAFGPVGAQPRWRVQSNPPTDGDDTGELNCRNVVNPSREHCGFGEREREYEGGPRGPVMDAVPVRPRDLRMLPHERNSVEE